jgi:hypothetical protein
MTRSDLIRSGAYYVPTEAQRVQLELARRAFHRFIDRLRVARAVERSGNVVLLERAAEKAKRRVYTGEPITGWGEL